MFRLEMAGSIGHAEFMIGSSRVMIADEFPDMKVLGPLSLGGSSASFMIYVADVDKASDVAIKAGMKIKRPIENHFYGDRSITLEDPFGHVWTLSSHIEDVLPEEMKKRMAALYGEQK